MPSHVRFYGQSLEWVLLNFDPFIRKADTRWQGPVPSLSSVFGGW